MTADFSSELVQVRKEYSNIFKVLKEKKLSIWNSVEMTFKNKSETLFQTYESWKNISPVNLYYKKC